MTSPVVDGAPGTGRARRVAEALGLATPFLLWAVFVVTPVWFQTAQLCFAHYDLGIYTQALARMSLDDPNPWLSARQVRIFNDHFDPILWLAKPLVPVLSAMWAAVVTETLLVLLSTVPILWLHARGQLDRLSTTLLCAFLLLSPATTDAVKFAIHPTTWTMLPFVLLGIAYHFRKTALLFVSLVLLFACKEEFPFVGLMLAVALWLRGDRRLAVGVAVLAVAWLGFVNVVRPAWMGPVEDYGARLKRGLDAGLLSYVAERLAPKHLSRIGTLAVLVLPVGIWAWRERLKPDWAWFLVLLPMLGIRFLGMAWRHQYGAPLSVAVAVGLLPLLLARRPPVWVVVATGLLLVTTNETSLKKLVPTLVARASNPPICPADPSRLASVHRAVDVLAANPEGRVLLNGNLISPLAARDEVYAVGGPQPPGKWTYDWVLVEKPPLGNGEPATPEAIQALITRWRAQEGTEVLIDDAYVFLARGRFSDAL
ncbi:DUF2079 domain-containing protein [Pyxidicoccus fallax]|uniref:DUF2079 domain-containing protein n=1 Tax=Pyxidicoccus fallax TaxID=394095 RepID=A0A848LJ47_9BACT|nr:DUF2079 domain-containing protein [Pyxidicoccus fallax]NMO17740.1 DUF2079 domain-containing protein [Pyxidicoccus fallax]NPC84607.1 DUF2079 domain-containing protein [Pyxidicoccus fallax]